MEKSADAFRTISEVAEVLETPAHVLRFWESRFPQIRPVKRAGGRRYYRPADIALLAGIKRLLHDEGMTIRGVQKILREQGVRHVAGLTTIEPRGYEPVEDAPEFVDEVEPEETPRMGEVLAFSLPPAEPRARPAAPAPEAAAEPEEELPQEAQADWQPEALGAPEPEQEAEADWQPEDEAELEPTESMPEEAALPAPDESDEVAAEAELPQEPALPDDPEAAEEAPGLWLPAALRALPPSALAGKREALLPLQARLVQLRDRLASAHRGGRR
ncbi:MerR family transcriptional regulator [Cereibacter changlensis]|uniref:MerR family transcriptional regulator n=1 Tax=Cereibacter changlensis TaxID=402884 RepID=UPI004033C486